MILSKDAEKALDHWINIPTWCTNDRTDIDRWYKFVDQYQKNHGFAIDEPTLREKIEAKIDGVVYEDLRDIIRERISLAYNILDFLKCTGR